MLMSGKDQPARLHYMAYSFRMLSPGDHVICAVTGQKILLEVEPNVRVDPVTALRAE